MEQEKVRVKVFIHAGDDRWEDHGTGVLSLYEINDEDQDKKALRIVVCDGRDDNTIFEADLNPGIVYQRQQDTLLSWEEDGKEMALSFEDETHCEITHKAIYSTFRKFEDFNGRCCDGGVIQEGDSDEQSAAQTSSDANLSRNEDLGEILRGFPSCDYENLTEIANIFVESVNIPSKRDILARVVEELGLIPKLLEIFHTCEDLEDMEGLYALYYIFKTMFTFTKYSVFEVILSDDYLMDVVGVLEYNPNISQKLEHRKILSSCHLKEIIPFANKTLKELIIQAHRVQYIQDIILPTPAIFEDRASLLTSFLFFRKNEIVEMIQEDEHFLAELFRLMLDDEVCDEARKDLTALLVELCNFSRMMQSDQKELFVAKLVKFEIISVIQRLMNLEDSSIRSLLIETCGRVVESHPHLIRETLSDASEEKSNLIILIANEFIDSPESNSSLVAHQIIKAILDTSNVNKECSKLDMTEFLTLFYSKCLGTIMAPLFTYTHNDCLKNESWKESLALEYIVEIFLCCLESNSNHVKNYVLSSDVLKRVVVLLNSKHSFLSHAAVRVLRRCVGIRDEFFNRYLSRENLLDHLVTQLKGKHKKYNIVNSAIIDVFEAIRTIGNRGLYGHLVQHHREFFETIHYVPTFKKLCEMYDHAMAGDARQNKQKTSLQGLPKPLKVSREVENEKEQSWFEEEGGVDSNPGSATSTPPPPPRLHYGLENVGVAADHKESPSSLLLPNGSTFSNNDIEEEEGTEADESGDITFLPSIKSKYHHDDDDDFLSSGSIRRVVIPNIRISLKRSSSLTDLEPNKQGFPGLSSSSLSSPGSTPLVDYPDDDETEMQHNTNQNYVEESEFINDSEIPSSKKPKVLDTT